MFSYDVIICSYCGEVYLSEQLESILNQTIKPNKIIISDDSLSDKTVIVAKAVLDKYPDVDYFIVQGPRRGIVHNFLSSLKHSNSEFLLLSDQDDIWELDKVEMLFKLAITEKQSQPLLLFSDASLINEKGELFCDSFIKKQGLNLNILKDDSVQLENCIQGATCCINSKLRMLLIEATDVIDLNSVVMHDWFIAIIANYSGRIRYCNQPLIKYRIHNANQVGYRSLFKRGTRFLVSPLSSLNIIRYNLKHRSVIMRFLLDKNLVSIYDFNSPQLNELSFIKKIIYRPILYWDLFYNNLKRS